MSHFRQKPVQFIHSHTGLLIANKLYTRIRKALGEYIWYVRARLFGIYYHPVKYIISSDGKLVYINNPKTACSTIKLALLRREHPEEAVNDDQSVHDLIEPLTRRKASNIRNNAIIFTFVRNPFERLVSLYLNKFRSMKNIEVEGFYFHNYLNGIFSQKMSFREFAMTVCKIPDAVADAHFRSQSATVFHNSRLNIDIIGKLENFQNDWDQLNRLSGSSMKIEHYNRSDKYDYREFYTQELVKQVADRYRDDIKLFGYSNEYHELLEQTASQAPDGNMAGR